MFLSTPCDYYMADGPKIACSEADCPVGHIGYSQDEKPWQYALYQNMLIFEYFRLILSPSLKKCTRIAQLESSNCFLFYWNHLKYLNNSQLEMPGHMAKWALPRT